MNPTKFLRSILALGLSGALLSPMLAHAEEGMWTFDNPPRKQLEEKYGFSPTREWLDHVRLASVRFNDGGSGSFVSPHGLVLTNHHVARDLPYGSQPRSSSQLLHQLHQLQQVLWRNKNLPPATTINGSGATTVVQLAGIEPKRPSAWWK
jgi:hypothetical protein